jgi:hypothetical protein
MAYLNLSQSSMNNTKQNSVLSSFFRNNIPWVRLAPPRENEPNMVVRILPGMDFSFQNNTEALLSSTEPFKTASGQYTSWAQFVKGYMFFGSFKMHLLSPDTLDMTSHTYPRRGADAFCDLRSFIFFNTGKYATTNPLTGQPTITPEEEELIKYRPYSPNNTAANFESVKLPSKPRTFVLSNVLHRNPQTEQMEQKIGVYSEQMFQTLVQIVKQQIAANSGLSAVSANYPELLFGDVTDQETGCLLEVRYCHNTLTNNRILTLTPSKDPNNETRLGYSQYPVSDDILKKRYILCDPENVLEIWTYQQQLDLLCKDPMFPIDLLKKAKDNGVFKDAELHLELREEGLEMLARRESFKRNAAEGIYTPQPGVAKAAANLPPVNVEALHTASISAKTAVEPDLIVEDYHEDAQNSAPVVEEVKPAETVKRSVQGEPYTPTSNTDIPEDNATLSRAKASLSAEDYEKFRTLHMAMITNPQKMTPQTMMEYFQLNAKIH